MQESLFSRRKLYLTAQQAYFSCASATRSEFQVETPGRSRGDQKVFTVERSVLNLKNSKKRSWGVRLIEKVSGYPHLVSPLRDEWWESWTEIVEHYSSRTSQLPEDRYCAFQGILQEQQTALDLRCVGGLPVRLLPVALGWNHGPFEKTEDTSSTSTTIRFAERIDAYPSWSWAGWSGRVTFPSWHDLYKPCLRNIIILGENAFETLQYRRSGRISDRRRRDGSSIPLLPLSVCANYNPAANDSLSQAADTSPDTGVGKLLGFESHCVALSTFTYVADGNFVLIIAHGARAGTITLPHPMSTSRLYRAAGIYLLVGTSQRKLCFLYRDQYRPASFLEAQDKLKYRVRRYCSWIILALPALVADSMLMRYFCSPAETLDPGAVFSALVISTVLSPVGYLLTSFLLQSILYYLGIDRIAHLIWVEDVGNGVYERKGAGEMSLRVFRKARPEKRVLKLR